MSDSELKRQTRDDLRRDSQAAPAIFNAQANAQANVQANVRAGTRAGKRSTGRKLGLVASVAGLLAVGVLGFSRYNEPQPASTEIPHREIVEAASEPEVHDALNPEMHFTYGEALLDANRLDDAANAFRRAAELRPDYANAWAGIADVHRRKGDAVGYVDNLRRAIGAKPEDNERVSLLADYLFELGLIEQGDRYLRRAAAIAPAHPMTRASRLRMAIAAGDRARAVDIARDMIADDVGNRHGSYLVALRYFVDLSIENGDAESAYLFIENNAQAVNRPERMDAGLKYLFAQSSMFPLWFAALPDDQAEQKVLAWANRLESLGFDESDMPREHVDIHLLRGDTAAAVDLALAGILAKPAADNTGWQGWIERDLVAPLAADPRVRDRLDAYARDTASIRKVLVDYFAGVDDFAGLPAE